MNFSFDTGFIKWQNNMNEEFKIPLISIIVPVYKAEKYLHDCLDSILAQTFSDFELILINDGSPDNSGSICDGYVVKDHRVKVIHKPNGGASSARNAGVDAAQGKYIGWVDADDCVAPDMFYTLFNLIEKYNADIADCQYYMLNGDHSIKSGLDEPVVFGNGDFIMKEFFAAKMKPGLTTKIYKRELWKNIRFPLGRNHQDCYVNMLFALMPLIYVRTSEAKYYYIIRENSITTTRTAREIREAIYKYDYTMKLAATSESNGLAKKYLTKDAINRFMCRYLEVSVNSNIKNQNVYNYYIRKKLGPSLIKLMLFSNLPIKTRISYTLLLLNLKGLQVILHKHLGKRRC
jgi:glycosyltransferase involved in cell wall biosynthesis